MIALENRRTTGMAKRRNQTGGKVSIILQTTRFLASQPATAACGLTNPLTITTSISRSIIKRRNLKISPTVFTNSDIYPETVLHLGFNLDNGICTTSAPIDRIRAAAADA